MIPAARVKSLKLRTKRVVCMVIQENEQKEATYHILEWRASAFERSLMLPTDVQTEKAKADFVDGVLTITLPKAEAVKPKIITVKAK